MKSHTPPRLLLGIPCHNEAESIVALIHELRKSAPPLDALVIDDASKDETAKLAGALTRVAKLPINLGIGGAVQTGIRYAFEHGYDFYLQIDGDGQHPPDQIATLLEAYQEKPANLLIGSRFCGLKSFESTQLRRIGIRVISKTLRLLYRIHVADPTSGFRLFDRKAIAYFRDRYPIDYPEPLSLGMATRDGLTFREVPVKMRERQGGQSSIYGLKSIRYMVRVIGYLFIYRLAG